MGTAVAISCVGAVGASAGCDSRFAGSDIDWLAVSTGRSHVCALRRYPGATAASLYCSGDFGVP